RCPLPSAPAPARRRLASLRVEPLESRDVPSLLGNQLFPADNPWNQRIANAPVAANSATLVASIGLSRSLHPDFGAALYAGSAPGTPSRAVPGPHPTVNVLIAPFSPKSDHPPTPTPANAAIEGDPLPSDQNTGDRHLLVYDQDHNVVYETYNT